GEKGALELIRQFGSVEGAMERAGEVQRKMYRESLQNNQEIIKLSKELATIHCDVPLEFNFESLSVQEPDNEALREIYRKLEFHTLLRALAPAPVPQAERDYQQLSAEAELQAWLGGLPADARVAVASGQWMDQVMLGFAAAPGVARTVVSRSIPTRAAV